MGGGAIAAAAAPIDWARSEDPTRDGPYLSPIHEEARMKALGFATALGVVALGILACGTTISARASMDGSKIEVGVDFAPGDKTVFIEKTTGNARVDIEFRDANGNVLGTVTGAGPGDSVPIPDGAATGIVSGPSTATSCTGCAPPGGGGTNATKAGYQSMEPTAGFTGEYWVAVLPMAVFPDPSAPDSGPLANKSAGFVIQSERPLTMEQRFNRIRAYLFAGPLAAPKVPADVEIEHLAWMEPNEFGPGARLWSYAVTDDWFLYDPLWNGSTLGYTTHLPGNGWTVRESSVPLSSFNVPGFNQLTVTSQTAEDPAPISIDYSVLSN